MSTTLQKPAVLVLEDGTVHFGKAFGKIGTTSAEICFNTGMTGYQEVFTDPSYLGQIVVMTAPMIGNYGINPDDMESARPQISGVVVRELARRASNWRSKMELGAWLAEQGIPLIEGVDTRKLTRHIRERGAMRGVIAEGAEPSRELTARLLAELPRGHVRRLEARHWIPTESPAEMRRAIEEWCEGLAAGRGA